MKVLVVIAHPERHSFACALADTAVTTLRAQGHEVELSDLYRMGWQAPISEQDFSADRADTAYLDISKEQEHAFMIGLGPQDILEEQRKVADADLVIFHFPMWWFSMPAIMKGWIDRVFSRGFAYSKGRKYGTGHFQGKRAMLCLTTGTASTLYEPNGIDGDILHVLWPIHNGILAYTGFTVLPPSVSWAPGQVTAEDRQQYLDDYAERLGRVDSIEPLFFHPWSDYDRTQRLLPGVKARSGVQWNPLAGQTFEDAAAGYTPQVNP
jgi:NAD(P)H dehydrogenase (quinone)